MLFASLFGLLSQLLGTFVTVDVTVSDETGAPVSNVVVRLSTLRRAVDLDADYKNYQRQTDGSGRVSFRYYAVDTDFSCSIDDPEFANFPRERFKTTSHNFWSTFHEKEKKLHYVIKKKPIPEKIIT